MLGCKGWKEIVKTWHGTMRQNHRRPKSDGDVKNLTKTPKIGRKRQKIWWRRLESGRPEKLPESDKCENWTDCGFKPFFCKINSPLYVYHVKFPYSVISASFSSYFPYLRVIEVVPILKSSHRRFIFNKVNIKCYKQVWLLNSPQKWYWNFCLGAALSTETSWCTRADTAKI